MGILGIETFEVVEILLLDLCGTDDEYFFVVKHAFQTLILQECKL